MRYTYREPMCSMQIDLLLYFCTALCPSNCHTVHLASRYSDRWIHGIATYEYHLWQILPTVVWHVHRVPVWKTHSKAGWISVESTMSYAHRATPKNQKKIQDCNNWICMILILILNTNVFLKTAWKFLAYKKIYNEYWMFNFHQQCQYFDLHTVYV